MSETKYKLVESIGSKLIPVTSYDGAHIHHPSKNAKGLQTGNELDFEKGRSHAKVDGEHEEVRYLNGAEFVKKDLIFLENGSGNTSVPAPAAGYVYFDKVDGQANIYDAPKPNGELIARVFHLKPATFSNANGEKIEYGQPLGTQGQTGKNGMPDPENYGVHAHVEYNIKHLDQFKQYILDINSGAIAPSKYPSQNTESPTTDKEYRNKYDIEAQVSSLELTNTAQTLIADATHHVQKWVADNGLQWNEQFNQAAHSVASAAHEKGMTGINLFAVNGGQIDFGHKEGFMLKTGSVETAVASNTDISKSLQAMADVDQKQSQTQSNTQQQTFAQNKEHSGFQRG